MVICNKFLVGIGLLFLLSSFHSEFFTAVVDLENLLDTEEALINTLEKYIKVEEQKISVLKWYLKSYQKELGAAQKDPESYLANPLNAFVLVKQLTADLNQVKTLIGTNISTDTLTNILNKDMKFPTDEDLNGAAVGLMRLQDTYRLNTTSMARGVLNGVQYTGELTASDCFELGRQLYKNGYYNYAQMWMEEANVRFKPDKNLIINQSDILEYLVLSSYKQGHIADALNFTNILLDIMPYNSRAISDKLYYSNQLKKMQEHKKTEDFMDVKPNYTDPNSKDLYKALCRGEITTSLQRLGKLSCRYFSGNNNFLKVAPFKMEEIYVKPDIYLFHEVISDAEIETIKRISHPRLSRAMVQRRGTYEFARYRISKSAWLEDRDHKYVAGISQRVADMTGLSMKSAELLQVANYGIGGHYDLHFDFTKKGDPYSYSGAGNRIATVLFYMSDVTQGGATVFPYTKVTLWPKKGSAAFWFNLFPNGIGDKRTKHGACPVLIGSKWVANKWIHMKDQEFLRPCSEKPPAEDLTA